MSYAILVIFSRNVVNIHMTVTVREMIMETVQL